jgi:hypothetical protein
MLFSGNDVIRGTAIHRLWVEASSEQRGKVLLWTTGSKHTVKAARGSQC